MFIFHLILQYSIAVECDVKALFEEQKSLMPANEARIRLPDGTSFMNPYSTQGPNDLDLPSKRVNGVSDRISSRPWDSGLLPRSPNDLKKLFEEVRSIMISEIKGASRILSPYQKLMIDRVKNIKFEITDNCSSMASNISSSQVVQLCNRALRLPTSALVGILGHEIGHSMDLCSTGCPNHKKVNPDKPLTARLVEPSASVDLKSYFSLSDKYPSSTHMIVTEDDAAVNSAVGNLVSQGHLINVDQGIPLNQNPLVSTYNCLQNNFNYPSLVKTQDAVCEGINFTEAGAQIWGARTLGRYLDENPPQTKLEKLAVFASAEVSSMISKGSSSKSTDFNTIYMSDPLIQKALGCEPKAKQNCMTHFNPSESLRSNNNTGSGRLSSPSTNDTVE